MKSTVIRELDRLEDFLKHKGQLHCSVIQGLDFSGLDLDWKKLDFKGAVFLGCYFPEDITADFLIQHGAVVFPNLPNLPYKPYRAKLYSREELMQGWGPIDDQSVDKRIYDHFVSKGRAKPDILESLAQRLHDHAIDDGLRDLLEGRVEDDGVKKVVAVMGGHGTPRTDAYYKKIVKLTRDLTRAGYYIASGGGPGIMEAANLGAWLAEVDDDGLEEVFALLAIAPVYSDPGYMQAAQSVIDFYPNGNSSIAVPTWFYGHEPTNLFSKRIAKYFSNSIREDGLLAIAEYGVIFAPGSAGTTQEIFMDATQNHYVTFDKVSPMVFLGEERYNQETIIYPCIKQLAEGNAYANMLHCTDDTQDVLDFIVNHPPYETEG
ncbi:MAG: putative Rossmann-fold nucleotide-binding protein [Rubritalea sp.]|jgi:predicted Rossmann-fold nucleotide-binding protein